MLLLKVLFWKCSTSLIDHFNGFGQLCFLKQLMYLWRVFLLYSKIKFINKYFSNFDFKIYKLKLMIYFLKKTYNKVKAPITAKRRIIF